MNTINESAPIRNQDYILRYWQGHIFFYGWIALNFLYIVIEKASIHLVYVELAAYIIAGIFWRLVSQKMYAKIIKRNC